MRLSASKGDVVEEEPENNNAVFQSIQDTNIESRTKDSTGAVNQFGLDVADHTPVWRRRIPKRPMCRIDMHCGE